MTENPKIRITKIFQFEMAHALLGYDGQCKNIHGHSYKLHVTLIGVVNRKRGDAKDGMVRDFKDIKQIVKQCIISKYDHALVLNKMIDPTLKGILNRNYEKLIFTDYQPTCELLITKFASELISVLSNEIELFSMRLYETESSYAEWFQSDN